jgi:hypothetical protein
MATSVVRYDLFAADAPIARIHDIFVMVRHPRRLWESTTRVLIDVKENIVLVVMRSGAALKYSFEVYPLASEA